MFEMGGPALERLGEAVEADASAEVAALEAFEAFSGAQQVGGTDADQVGQDAEADETCADLGFKELTFDWMDFQPQTGQVLFDGDSGCGQEGWVIGEQGEIIDIAEILLGWELFGDEVIEAVEVDIGEKLAGEVADGQSLAAATGGEGRIAGEIVEDGVLGIAVVNDLVDQPEGIGALNFAAD